MQRNHRRIITMLGVTLGLGVIGVSEHTTPVHASSSTYKIVKLTSLNQEANHWDSNKGALYNQSHTKKIANLSHYPNTTWYATKQATFSHGGTRAIYKYVHSNKGVTGWVWHGYLAKGKALPKSSFTLKVAKAGVAMDATNGKVVWAKNASTARPIASVAKLMTLYLTEKKVATSGSWNDQVTITSQGLVNMSNDSACGGFKFKLGQKLTVQQLFDAALLDSSNNAAIALGQYVAGSNSAFIKQMNAQAASWGLKHTSFVSASGLENSDLRAFGYAYGTANANEVSAQDVATIARKLITDYPDILTTASIGSMKVAGQSVYNYNNLLKGRAYYRAALNVDGLKTGYTPLAGYCFVGTGQAAGKHRIITVVLHDEDEFTETRDLMSFVNASGAVNA